MKAKLQAILTGMPQDEAAYAKVAHEMPEVITARDRPNAKLAEGATRYETQLATQIRSSSFIYGIPAAERTTSQDGGYAGTDGEEDEGGNAHGAGSDDEMIDPELKAAALNSSRSEEGVVEVQEVTEGMDVDSTLDDRVATPPAP